MTLVTLTVEGSFGQGLGTKVLTRVSLKESGGEGQTMVWRGADTDSSFQIITHSHYLVCQWAHYLHPSWSDGFNW